MTLEKEILDYLQLINTDGIGPKTFSQLTERFGSAANALSQLPPRYRACDRRFAEQELALAQKLGVHILIDTDSAYPQALRAVADHPPLLYVKGNVEILTQTPALAVVGSRSASINGRKLASKISYDLTNQGVLIVSGMARGIDSAAHKGALFASNNHGATIAVLGTGVDVPYPAENQSLYEQIAAQGCIVSELPLRTTPQAANFPRRNRIISGLSAGVLVIEANLHSGSLITAYTAAEQGREVMAIPGSPLDGRSQGANKLIKDGAFLVEGVDDIIPVLQSAAPRHRVSRPAPCQQELFTSPLDNTPKLDNIPEQAAEKTSIIDYITADGVYIDEIIETANLDSAVVATELLELELEGRIIRQAGSKVALIK